MSQRVEAVGTDSKIALALPETVGDVRGKHVCYVSLLSDTVDHEAREQDGTD